MIVGEANPRMATIDHLISRYDPRRWLREETNKQRKVLACFECNQKRDREETSKLSVEEKKARSWKLTFRPSNKFKVPVNTLEELKELFAHKGIELDIKNGQPKIINIKSM